MKKPSPIALLSQQTKPCFVCASPTRRIRSGSHLHGPPTDPKDFFRICLTCDPDWSSAIFETPSYYRPAPLQSDPSDMSDPSDSSR